jgi:hypothetical protein
MANNKIVFSARIRASDPRTGAMSEDLHRVLDHIVRKLNAADALDGGTATAQDIVEALQK